jgi:predicted dehydrogenase
LKKVQTFGLLRMEKASIKNMKRLRLGVVGVGYLGSLHAQKYAAIEGIDLVGLTDIDYPRAQAVAGKYNTKAYKSHEELLPHVDGVSLAVPTVSHFEIGRDILDQGIHLLVEKPITLALKDAEELIALAKERNAILQTGHIERFNPVVMEMESLISQPLFIECHRLNPYTKRGTDVDVVLDLMIHDLDIILHFVDSDIARIDAIGMPAVSGKTDFAHASIQFSNDTRANLTASRVSTESVRTIRVFQPDSYISADYKNRKIGVTRFEAQGGNGADLAGVAHREDGFLGSDPLADQIRSFVESIRNCTEPRVTGVDGKMALSVALSIIEQIQRKGETLN